MADITPRAQEAKKAAEVLVKNLKVSHKSYTLADASAQSGLSILDAERGLHYLVAEYRGHLSATDSGELLFSFPTAFTKPWERIDRLTKMWRKVKSSLLGIAKFVVRAWISIVLVGYVAIFALILIALSFAKNNDRNSDSSSFGGTLLFHTLFRVILDSLFWTFHPFSPFYVGYNDPYNQRPREKTGHFYEKVNRFFFGPEKVEEDELAVNRAILDEIRALNGRIGLADILRVSGLEREKAEPLMSKLMLDYDGDVVVADNGGISYRFINIRKTTQDLVMRRPAPIWERLEKLLPLTGNTAGSNLLIAGLNGFNLFMSSIAISGGWTVAKLQYLLTVSQQQARLGLAPPMPEGTPLVLGWIPFCFSLALFALPAARILLRPKEKQRVAHENGRRGLLRGVLTRLNLKGIDEGTLKNEWERSAQTKPATKELVHEIVKLGGEMEIQDNGQTLYRFKDLENENAALKEERSKAQASERDAGQVVFSSAKN